jgi:hypothetical protein
VTRFSVENIDDGIYSTVNISKGYPSVWSSFILVQKEWLIRGLSRMEENKGDAAPGKINRIIR